MPRLLCTISHHGYGHLAQTSAVLNRLRRELPALDLIIVSALDLAILNKRIDGPFQHMQQDTEVGMIMKNALQVDAQASHEAYRRFHHRWEQKVENAAQWIHLANPDLVFSNVSYLTIAAANKLSLPAIAMCSLNWHDIYTHYCSHYPGSTLLQQQMGDAYNGVTVFLRPEPSMPMPTIQRTRTIGCIARLGTGRQDTLRTRLGASDTDRIVLVALGGIPTELDMSHWPDKNIVYLTEPEQQGKHPRAVSWRKLGMDFLDVLAAVDVMITKPGYGSFTEAACHGIPVIYLARPDWPESPFLETWLKHQVPCEKASDMMKIGSSIDTLISSLIAQRTPARVTPLGVEDCCAILGDHLL